MQNFIVLKKKLFKLNKFDSIIKKSNEIKNFTTFDVDTEWKQFLDKNEDIDFATNFPSPSESKVFTLKNIISAVAAVSVLVLVFTLAFKPEKKLRETYTALHKDDIIKIVDGTTIKLDSAAIISYPLTLRNLSERRIDLKGNATFDVTRSNLPLKVDYGDIMIEVIGTQFTLEQISGKYTVEVIEGVVRITQKTRKENSVILYKGDKYGFEENQFVNLAQPIQVNNDSVIIQPKKYNIEGENKTKISKNKVDVVKGSVYKLDSVLKNYLKKLHKNKIKIDKKFKYNKDQRIRVDLNQPYKDVLASLKSQGVIDYTPGKCADCYIILSPVKK